MLSILPPLLAFGGLGILLLRFILGSIYILWSYNTIKKDNLKWGVDRNTARTILGGVIGLLLIIGLFTQIVALVSAVMLGIKLHRKIKNREFLTDGVNYYLILFIISVSLIFLGAGYFAFDLPL